MPQRHLALDVLPVLKKHAARVDESAGFPVESIQALRDSGLFGLLVPVEYGGLGGDLGDLVDIAQTLASGCLSTAMIWGMHCQQVESITTFASSSLREELLPRIARGELYLASVTTEPAKGGHLLSANASLADDGGLVRVERDGPIVTGGAYAEGFLITMRDAAKARENQVTLVYAGREQLQIDAFGEWNPLGMRGTHSVGMKLTGDIPSRQIVGARGRYRTIAVESMIPAAHLTWSACWLGAARSALADVVGLIRSPRRSPSLDPTSPLVSERLARARMDLEIVSAYLARVRDEVLTRRANGHSLDTPATQVHLNSLKVIAAEHTHRAVDRLVQLTGLGTGYLRSSPIPLERHYRDLRSASLNYSNDRLLTATGSLAVLDRSVSLA